MRGNIIETQQAMDWQLERMLDQNRTNRMLMEEELEREKTETARRRKTEAKRMFCAGAASVVAMMYGIAGMLVPAVMIGAAAYMMIWGVAK